MEYFKEVEYSSVDRSHRAWGLTSTISCPYVIIVVVIVMVLVVVVVVVFIVIVVFSIQQIREVPIGKCKGGTAM